MTAPAWIALTGIATITVIEIVVDLLNLGRLDKANERLRAYHARTALLDITHALVRLNLLAAFWIGGGFAWLDRATGSALPHPVAAGLAFFGLLGLGSALIDLPFRAVRTFGIEQEFGFNRTGPALFASDTVRGLLLSGLLGGAMLAVVLFLLHRFGPAAWLPVWLVTGVFSVLLTLAAPALIFPLFNRFTPLPESPLREAVCGLCARAGFPVRDVCTMDGSRRTSRANAFFAGIGPSRRIALFDTVLARHPEPEILAVVAHELGHFRKRHLPRSLAASLLGAGLLLFAGAQLIERGVASRILGEGVAPVSAAALLGAAFGLTPLSWLLGIAGLALSRRHEFEADRFAAENLGEPGAMAGALGRLGQDNLTHPDPHPLAILLHASHPPIPERIARLG